MQRLRAFSQIWSKTSTPARRSARTLQNTSKKIQARGFCVFWLRTLLDFLQRPLDLCLQLAKRRHRAQQTRLGRPVGRARLRSFLVSCLSAVVTSC